MIIHITWFHVPAKGLPSSGVSWWSHPCSEWSRNLAFHLSRPVEMPLGLASQERRSCPMPSVLQMRRCSGSCWAIDLVNALKNKQAIKGDNRKHSNSFSWHSVMLIKVFLRRRMIPTNATKYFSGIFGFPDVLNITYSFRCGSWGWNVTK